MADGFDQLGRDDSDTVTEDNVYASRRRAPISGNEARLRRISDPDALIESEYEVYKDEVLRAVSGKLAASKIQFSELDLDGFYNQAWHSLYLKLADGEEVENHKGMLIAIAHRRAVDEFRALHPDRRADVEQLDDLGTHADIDALLDDRARVQQFVHGLRGRLSDRELQAAGLCYVYGYTRPEAAAVVGVRPKRMEKIMDSVSKKISPMMGDIKKGEWCESQSSLINAYAMGLLDDDTERYSIAVEHLRDCPACRRDVLRKRGIAAAIAPLPVLLAFGKLGVAAGAAGAGAVVAGGHSAGAGAGGGSAGAASAGSGLAVGPVAAGAAGAVAVVATAAVIANPFSAGKPPTPVTPAKPPAVAAGKSAAAAKSAAKAKKAKVKARKAKRKRAAAKQESPAPAQATTQPQAPAQPAPAPAPEPAPTYDGAGEFDLR